MSDSPNPTNLNSFKVAQLNVSGIDTSLDLVVQYLETHNIDIILLTETFLLRGQLYTHWSQHHNYAQTSGNARKGFGGLSFLIRPNFPFHVHPIPISSPHKLSIVIGSTLTLHGFYLPPTTLPFPVYQSLLSEIDFDTTPSVICLGDFNTRLGEHTGDTRFVTPRAPFFLNWLSVNSSIVWNSQLTKGVPTYQVNNGRSSVLDFFISKPTIFSTTPSLVVDSTFNLNSDHHLLHLEFQLTSNVQTLPPHSAPPRRLWNLQKFNDPEVLKLYLRSFYKSIFPLQQELHTFIQQIQSDNFELFSANTSAENTRKFHNEKQKITNINLKNNFDFTSSTTTTPQEFIDRMGSDLENIIYQTLDDTVQPRPHKPKNWKWFWTDDLQTLADERLNAYQIWYSYSTDPNAMVETIGDYWYTYKVLCKKLKNLIKKTKRLHWQRFCIDIQNQPTNEVYAILKKIRKKHTPSSTYSHEAGPQTAADTMATHLRDVFGGSQENLSSWRCSRTPLYKSLTLPSFFTPGAIGQALHEMPSRKAPGKDSITKEMLSPIAYPLCNFLALYFTLCYTYAWTPSHWRSALVHPIFKKGDPTLPSNYRPISLTTTFRKLFERCLISPLLDSMPALDPAQGGFRALRGSVDQTLNLLALQTQFEQQYNTKPAMAFLDISQAYDSINRRFIWKKLHASLPQPLFHTLRNLFNMVTIEVVISNASSFPIYPIKGVLQGSILSPFLYAVFINDLPAALRTIPTRYPINIDLAIGEDPSSDSPTAITYPSDTNFYGYGHSPSPSVPFLSEADASHHCSSGIIRRQVAVHCLLYADDVCLIAHKRDMPLLMAVAEDFSNSNQFRWNPSKCALVNYRSSSRPITLYDIPIPVVPSYDYLGVPINTSGVDNNLFFNSTSKKARSSMALFRRIGVHQYGLGLYTALRVYKVFIRPILEFAIAILGLNATTIMHLEQTQAQCLNMTLNRSISSSAPPFALNIMGCVPSIYTRFQILQFKYYVRMLDSLPPFALLSAIRYTHTKYRIAKPFWNVFLKNKLWKQYEVDGDVLEPSDVCTIFITKHFKKWGDKKPACKRALRLRDDDLSKFDPLLYYPCTQQERLRLIKWRLHWLPSFPLQTCICSHPNADRNHYKDCPTTMSISCKLSMHLPDDFPLDDELDNNNKPITHLLDRLLTALPPKLSETRDTHWEETWPMILEWITIIDHSSHANGTFDTEPTAGEVYKHWLNHSPSDSS